MHIKVPKSIKRYNSLALELICIGIFLENDFSNPCPPINFEQLMSHMDIIGHVAAAPGRGPPSVA